MAIILDFSNLTMYDVGIKGKMVMTAQDQFNAWFEKNTDCFKLQRPFLRDVWVPIEKLKKIWMDGWEEGYRTHKDEARDWNDPQ